MVQLTLKIYHGLFANRTWSEEKIKDDHVSTRTTKKVLMPPLSHEELGVEAREPETKE